MKFMINEVIPVKKRTRRKLLHLLRGITLLLTLIAVTIGILLFLSAKKHANSSEDSSALSGIENTRKNDTLSLPDSEDNRKDEAMIITTDPDVYTYENLVHDTQLLSQQYPEYFMADSLGTTVDQRQLIHFVIGNPNASQKILINAGIHAREYITSQLLMKQTVTFLTHLAAQDSYGEIPYSELLQDRAIHVICMVNPDGITISQQGLDGIQTEEVRQTIQQIAALDGTAITDEYLTRWKSNGNGVDLNRNFDAHWSEYNDPVGHPSADHYKGTAPGCETESKALIDLTFKEQFIRTISYHTQGQVIYWYFGQTGTLYDQTLAFGQTISNLTGYPLDANYEFLDPAGYKDWAIENQQIPSLTIEIGTETSPVPSSQFPTIWAQNQFVWEETLLSLS